MKEKKLKVFSSKKTALNNLPIGNYESSLYCTGQYETSINEITTSINNIKAIYKSYRNDRYGNYVKLYCITQN